MAVPVAVPQNARDLLDRVDYSDAHEVRATTPRTAREGMHRALASAPRLLMLARAAHRGLRLHLVPADADHPLGWSILSETPGRLVIGSDGPLLTPRIQIEVVGDRVTVATVMRYEQRATAAVWAGVAPVHRLVLRRLVDASV